MNKDLLRFYFTFQGRATRYDFNVRYALVMVVGSILAFIADWMLLGNVVFTKGAEFLFSNLWNLLFLIPTFAFTCRRLHDLNYSGWWQILVYALPIIFIIAIAIKFGFSIAVSPLMMTASFLLVSMASIVFFLGFFLVLSCVRGTTGANRFGPDPSENLNVGQ